ncbi:uncharacterized protein [Diadema antillarum]|uniref:uncharacterized protein n=1 Tax=Diadema antillarum TaxID=105358 RepID=UPI003A8C3A93
MSEGDGSRRDRRPTEKGLQHQTDVTMKTWKDAVRLWRRRANKHRQLMVEDDVKVEVIKESRNLVQEAMDKAISAQEQLTALAPSANTDDDIEEKLEEMEEEHTSLMRETLKIILQLKGGTLSSKSGSRSSKRRVQDWINSQESISSKASSVDKEVSPPPVESVIKMEDHTSPVERAPKKDDVKSSSQEKQPADQHSTHDVLANSLKELLCFNRLPLPEPGIFAGNPLDYTLWRRSYDALIEHRGIPHGERFYFLLKYLTGEPRSLVQGYSMIGDAAGYNEAKRALEQRYGDHFVVSNAYRDKLDSWPKIGARDATGLRRLGDFLKQCDTASKYVPHLSHLDDERENRKLLMKLPDWLVVKWSRKVVEWRQQWGTFPPFTVFTSFIDEEAVIACDPVTSLQSLQTPKDRRKSAVSGFQQTGTQHRNQREGSAVKGPPSCIFCKGQHHLAECSSFSAETMQKKRQVVRENGLCFGCLKRGHLLKECRKRQTCSSCKGKHPTVLHDEEWKQRQQDAKKERDVKEMLESKSCASNLDSSHSTKSSMIVPVWLSHESCHEDRLVYAMLDTQSDTSFILTETKEAMRIKGVEVNLLLSTMTKANERIASEKVTGLKVKAFNNSEKIINLPPTYTRDIMPADRHHIPTPDMARSYQHLSRIANLVAPLQDVEIGLLIGYDCAKALAPRAVIHSPDDRGPYAVQTDLGWTIVGTVNEEYADSHDDPIGVSHRTAVRVVPEEVQLQGCRSEVIFVRPTTMKEEIAPLHVIQLPEADFTPDRKQKPYSQNDVKFIRMMEKEIHITQSGHYEMPLPFKEEKTPLLPNNRSVAFKRLNHLKRKFENDAIYYEQYVLQMNNLIQKGHAERVTEPGESGKRWYIPHHGVQEPKKLRVVFDCSSQFKGECLNSHLLTGPDLTNALAGVLCRFRKENVAFMCDIKEMFHQFHVNEEHRDYLRFLWWPNGDYYQEPVDYHMNVHLFGAASSPGCSNYGLKQIATDKADEIGHDAARFIHRDFYVDDGLKAVATEEEAIELISKTKKMCEHGGLHVHKVVSNSRKVLESVPVDDRAKEVKELNLLHDHLPIEKALGVQWCVESDKFRFRMTFQDKPLTRRGALSTVMSVFDPLGLLAPLLLPGKLILQELCRSSAARDDPLPDILQSKWDKWKADILQLDRLSIDRCYKPKGFGEIKNAELHHFCDASNLGYGHCTYLRLTNENGEVHCTMVIGKARVAPIKTVTVPRLELTAATLSVRMSSFLRTELDLNIDREIFWTDSRVVLGYIKNETRRFHVFVANRVCQIRDESSSSQWRHIGTKTNPADGASRGLTIDQIEASKWFTGPDFLWEKEIPDETKEEAALLPKDPEVKCETHASLQKVNGLELERFDHLSSWYRAKRAVANCLRLRSHLRKRCQARRDERDGKWDSKKVVMEPLCTELLLQAEKEIIKLIQGQTLGEMKAVDGNESHSKREKRRHCKAANRLYHLDPFKDDDGILRVGGRLRRSDISFESKHPAILPQTHLTKLIVSQCHADVAHGGRGMTINHLRMKGIWILGCSNFVAKFIFQCVTCRRLRQPPQLQKMADLPKDRLTPAPPFTYAGVDCFGPWLIKEGRKELKRYGLIFTCMASRAVHIEVLNALTTDAFINALRRFISVRGPVKQLRCDRGTNFVGAEAEFKRCAESSEGQVKDLLLKEGCDFIAFKFNVPASSHMGGVWERQIRSIRQVLDVLLHQAGQQLDDESLRTLMCEAAAIVNSRPLTTEFLNEPTHPTPLTPNHLLTQKTKIILPPPGSFCREDVYARKRWRRVQHLANEFWSRWRKEFLNLLQARQKWTKPHRNMEVGDVVIIKDDNAPRNSWPLGRIVEVYESKDDLVRKVKLAVGDTKLDNKGKRKGPVTYLDRPIHKLVLLVSNVDQE